MVLGITHISENNPDSVAKHCSYFVSTSCTRSHKATTTKHNKFHKKENNDHVAPHTERQIKDKSYVSMCLFLLCLLQIADI